MFISTKSQYALRAVFEIAKSDQQAIMTIGEIAKAQQVPQRYLEGILNQLRKGGLLEAQRGRSGGYKLAKDARNITVGDVVRLIDGQIRAVACVKEDQPTDCPMRTNCVFMPTWQKVQDAIDEALDSTDFAHLVECDNKSRQKECTNYTI